MSITTHSQHLPSSDNLRLSLPASGRRAYWRGEVGSW